MIKPRAQRLLEEIRNNRDSVTRLHTDAMIALSKSGILELLRAWSRAHIYTQDNPLDNMALRGAHAAGYAQCLDDLMEFQEFLKDEQPGLNLPMDFGAISQALKQGLINEKEANDLRSSATRTGAK